MKRKTEKRKVTNEEFEQAYTNKDNRLIIRSVTSMFANVIPEDELVSCGLNALWRCLSQHQSSYGQKFTTSLWRFTNWECLRELKNIQRTKKSLNIDNINVSTKQVSENLSHLRECMTLLSESNKQLIQEYYLDKRTMEEIGKLHGYSKEAARQKINRAVIELRKLCLSGV